MADKIMTAEDLAALRGERSTNIKYEPLTSEIEQEIFAKAKARAQEILDAESISPDAISGNCFYVSNNGDDFADGTTPQTAWCTISRLHRAQTDGTIKPGDGVFFERGSVWNACFYTRESGQYALMMQEGITYSAYGKGYKPLFTNSINASSPQDWLVTHEENIWVYNGNVGNRFYDIGNIVCDNGKGYGVKIIPNDPCNPFSPIGETEDDGMVTNGMGDVFHSGKTLCTKPSDVLQHNLQFIHDSVEGKLYMYFDKGNPGEYFNEIIMAKRGHIIRCNGSKNILVDNLAIKHGGSHGFTTGDAVNCTVQNCIFGWIGGSLQENNPFNRIRYGNAVENWGQCDGQYVHDCIVYQCFDAGLTTQTGLWDPKYPMHMNHVEYCNNVMAYSNSPVELWNSNPPDKQGEPYVNCVENSKFCGNYMFYSGYHFGHQRPFKNGSFGCLGGKAAGQIFTNTQMSDNVFMHTSSLVHYTRCLKLDGGRVGVEAYNNTYAISTSKYYTRGCENPITDEGCLALFPYGRECAEFLASRGCELGSTFYWYNGNLMPEEDHGVYIYQNK